MNSYIMSLLSINAGIEQLIVAMITSNLSREGHPSRIRINKDSEDGKTACILTDSIIMTDNLATVRFIEIEKAIETAKHGCCG
ncbi:MAG: hypothetical protein NUV76_06765 [Candidatus Kuenenia sp.]|nr:hypothetical protein [Candidatus Kuenenia sp.]